jgi:hypothetical protein
MFAVRAIMKKSSARLSKKLVMNRETLFVLARLELTGVVVGAAAGVADTGDVNCPVHHGLKSPG